MWSRDVARWVRCGLSVAGPFVCRCLNSLTMLRCHIPLIELDGPVSGIQLSEKGSRCRPREIASPPGKAEKAQHAVQGCLRKPLGPRPPLFVLGTQPLTQPFAGVTFHRLIGLADWPQTEVVGPPNHRAVELRYNYLLV